MSDEIEYIEPTQEHVGQMVEVRDSEAECWKTAKLTALIESDSDNSRFVAKKQGHCYSMSWKHARIPRPLTYAERQAKCGLKVGDRVRVVRDWEKGELGFEHNLYKEKGRCDHIGFISTIDNIFPNGVSLQWPVDRKLRYLFPYFVLEKVEDRVATQDDCGETVYVDGAPQDKFKIVLLWQEVDSVWRAVVRSGDNRFVYELSNLRVIE